MSRRIGLAVAALALQLVAVVLAHDLVYLARYGSRYGEALVHAGHGEAWTATVGTTLAIAAALFIAAVLRLARLGIFVSHARDTFGTGLAVRSTSGTLELGRLVRLWLRVGPRIAVISIVLLTIQENLERAALGGPMPGVGMLVSPEYPSALGITIAVGLLVGLVAALYEWRRRALVERLRIARGGLPCRAASAGRRRRINPWRPAISVLGRRSGLRAPPHRSVA